MKKIYTLLLFILISIGVYAQAPNKLNYQGLIRNSVGNPLGNTPVLLRISILDVANNVLFLEQHSTTTNSLGLYNVAIGTGSLLQGNFAAINWGAGNRYIKVEVSTNAGVTFINLGTNQLLSVPYALYAASGNTGPQGPAGPQGPQGTAGINGANGYTSLIKNTTEPVGLNCPFGGIKLEFGVDVNSNLFLDPSEVNPSLTQYICNGPIGNTGATGPQGPPGLTGPAGPQGIPGPTGATGPQGPIGLTGATGATGAQGPAGATGATGSQGAQGPIGLTGPQGPAGPTGATGIQGANGSNGLNQVVKTTLEPAGANCAAGGIKIEFGLDNNNNGILDAAEINATLTKYVCNGIQGSTGAQGIQGPPGPTGATGAQGPAGATGATGPQGAQGPIGLTGPAGPAGATGAQGPAGATGSTGPQGAQGPQGTAGANGLNSLTKTSTEPAGANCAAGGIKIEIGVDVNGNGNLDANEIITAQTKYVCNGTTGTTGATGPQGVAGAQGVTGNTGLSGLNSLIKTTIEPAGSNCQYGGIKIEVGLDSNRNGILNTNEISSSSTNYVCNLNTGSGSGSGSGLAYTNMQVFDSNGTFTVPAGVTKIMVEGWGGGSGCSGSGGVVSVGVGGSYGKSILNVTSGSTYIINIGQAGINGGAWNSSIIGGNSTFGSLFLIPGGSSTTQPIGVQFYVATVYKKVGVFGTNSSQTDWGIGGDAPCGGQGGSYYQNASVPGGGAGRGASNAAPGRIVVYW